MPVGEECEVAVHEEMPAGEECEVAVQEEMAVVYEEGMTGEGMTYEAVMREEGMTGEGMTYKAVVPSGVHTHAVAHPHAVAHAHTVAAEAAMECAGRNDGQGRAHRDHCNERSQLFVIHGQYSYLRTYRALESKLTPRLLALFPQSRIEKS